MPYELGRNERLIKIVDKSGKCILYGKYEKAEINQGVERVYNEGGAIRYKSIPGVNAMLLEGFEALPNPPENNNEFLNSINEC